MLRQRVESITQNYPSQFWLLFWGQFISATGEALIWPFLTIYSREHFGVSLTTIAGILAVRTCLTLISSFATGYISDHYGRKWLLVSGLVLTAVDYFWMSRVDDVVHFAMLLMAMGIFFPFFKVGSDSMVADLIPDTQRTDAYALMRMANNAGVAIGPIIGGFLAIISYDYVFILGSVAMLFYGLMIAFFTQESLPTQSNANHKVNPISGYKPVFLDRLFLSTIGAFTLSSIAAVTVFTILPVYVKENFGIAENGYGMILACNAIMIVLFQFSVTRITQRYSPLFMLAIGTVFWAIGLGAVAISKSFWFFVISMIIVTMGELIASPTATALAAHLAPEALRGRYMSLYSLTITLSSGLGPVFGGLLNDLISPSAVWYGGAMVSILCVIWFLLLYSRFPQVMEHLQQFNSVASSGDASN